MDQTGRPWRPDSELACGMPVAAFRWMQAPRLIRFSPKGTSPIDHEEMKRPWEAILVPKVGVVNIGQISLCDQQSYPTLPFRGLEKTCLPAGIRQRWQLSVAASTSAKWRLWFQTLDQNRQKAVAKIFSMHSKDTFWLEYEEWSKPRHERIVAAAAKMHVIRWRYIESRVTEENNSSEKARLVQCWIEAGVADTWSHWSRRIQVGNVFMVDQEIRERFVQYWKNTRMVDRQAMTPHQINILGLRLAPCHFRVPAEAHRFAEQIFSGKSYKEAVAEQKANFDSWTTERKVCRIEGYPDLVMWDGKVVHKDALLELTRSKKKPLTWKPLTWKSLTWKRKR